jgi:hypothetical protein
MKGIRRRAVAVAAFMYAGAVAAACSTSSEPRYTIITNYPAADPPFVLVPPISVPPIVDGADIGPTVAPPSSGNDSGLDAVDVLDAPGQGNITGDGSPANGSDSGPVMDANAPSVDGDAGADTASSYD